VTPKHPNRSVLSEELGTLMGRARRRFWRMAAPRLEAEGTSLVVWQVLCHLARAGRSTQSELSTAVAQHAAGISRLLEELEDQRIVKRDRDTLDRRRVYVRLTRTGKAHFDKLVPIIREMAEHCFEPLGDDERQMLRALLRKLVGDDAASPSGNRRRFL
jgi:MarR family transcriptional regulator, lower aerobic nicotinate degradation pathway regulator